MSLYTYRIFHTVVQQKSFSKAAKLLDLTPSAISHAIAGLEEEFGVELFVRTKKAAELSDGGRMIYGFVLDILNTSDMMNSMIAQIRRATVGSVRLGIPNSVATNLLAGMLGLFRTRYGDVNLIVQESGYQTLINKLISHELDLVIVSHSSVRHLKTPFQFSPLFQDRLVCVSPKDFIPENRSFVSAEELKHLEIIRIESGNATDVDSYMEAHGIQPQTRSIVSSDISQVFLVQCGFGHCITPELTLTGIEALSDVRVYPIVPYGTRTLGLLSSPAKYLSPVVKGLHDCIIDYTSAVDLSHGKAPRRETPPAHPAV